MNEDASDEVDPAWMAMLEKPATRGELLQLVQLLQVGLLGQSAFGAALIEGDEQLQRHMGENAVQIASEVGAALRTTVDRWRLEL